MYRSYGRLCCALVVAVLASGCAGVPLDQGQSNVRALVQPRISESVTGTAEASIDQWLATPLTLERAQQIALLRNPALQAAFARLGLTAADVFEAGRLQNPSLGLSWLLPLGSAEGSKVGASLFTSFADVLLRRSRQRIAGQEYTALQEQIASSALDVLADTQRAWFECVAAQQRVAVRESIAEAAQLTADLARRYREAGNISVLQLQIQRAEASQARIALHEARMQRVDARAELQKVLGLPAVQSGWSVPEALPEVPKSDAQQAEGLVARVLEQRLDISAARRHVQALTERQAATQRVRLLAESRVGAALEREPDGVRRLGPAVEVALPLFQQGQGAVARASAQLEMAESALQELEIGAQAEVVRHIARRDLARERSLAYRDELIPQREAVVAGTTEQANFMLVDSFAVLAARQQEYAAYAGYVDAQLSFWQAHVELLRATGSLRGTEESR